MLDHAPFNPPGSWTLRWILPGQVEATSWVRLTFSLPADTDLSGPGALATDQRFIRGTELWELGLYNKARIEFEEFATLLAQTLQTRSALPIICLTWASTVRASPPRVRC